MSWGERLAQMPEAARPGQVIVTVLTDGLENASEKYTWKDISGRIKRQTEEYKWNFFFLGANQDAIATAAQLSIAASNAATYAGDAVGTVASHLSHSRKIRGGAQDGDGSRVARRDPGCVRADVMPPPGGGRERASQTDLTTGVVSRACSESITDDLALYEQT